VRLDEVILDAPAASFDDCLHIFAGRIQASDAFVDFPLFLREVKAREEIVSTDTGAEIAFPHARSASVTRLFLAALRPREGVVFQPGRAAVRLLFLIGAPPEGVSAYLECVAWLSRKLKDPALKTALLGAPDSRAFAETLGAPFHE